MRFSVVSARRVGEQDLRISAGEKQAAGLLHLQDTGGPRDSLHEQIRRYPNNSSVGTNW